MGAGRNVTIAVIAALLVAGCKAPTRMATKVTEVPRVDTATSGGNRGYLLGTAPPAAEGRTTRQMIETVIEVPSAYKPKPGMGGAQQPEDQGPDVTEAPAESQPVEASGAPQRYDTYAVQKGESLWSIAAKPEIYGKASQWRRIFDANRDLLKTPDQVKAGMTLKIPRGEPSDDSTTYDDDEGITFKK